MLRIERFHNAAELETLIQQAQSKGLRIRLGSRDWTVEILDKAEAGFFDKFRSAESLAAVFKSELASLNNKLGELRAIESGSPVGGLGATREIRKVPGSNDPLHSARIDPEIEVHRTLAGVMPTIARISHHLGASVVSHKLHQLGRLLNDEQIPLKERTTYVLNALRHELSSLRQLADNEDTPGYFQLENFCDYVELTTLQRKKDAITTLPQIKSDTAAALYHPQDPFALKRFAYKAFPVIAHELGKDSKNKELSNRLQIVLGQFLKPDISSLDFDKSRQALLALQKDIHRALRKNPLGDTADAVFETIAQATPDKLESLLAEDLGLVAQALNHQGEFALANGLSQLATDLQSQSNINHLDLHHAVVELRFLAQLCLEKVDDFSQQAADPDKSHALRDRQRVRHFCYSFLSAVEPWNVSPQEYEYVRSRITQYEASKPYSAQPSGAATEQSSPQVTAAEAERFLEPQQESDIDKPWYELDPEEIFGKPGQDNSTGQSLKNVPSEIPFAPMQDSFDSTSISESARKFQSLVSTTASIELRTEEINPTPEFMVKAYAKEIQHRIDQRDFLDKIAMRDAQLNQERKARELASALTTTQASDVSQPSTPDDTVQASTASHQVLEYKTEPREHLDLNTLRSTLNQMRVDPKFYTSDSSELGQSIENEITNSIARQKAQPLNAVEESEYRIALRSFQLELSEFQYQGTQRQAIERAIATFNTQIDGDLSEVSAKIAPELSADQFKSLLKQYAKDASSNAALLARRVQQGYAHTEEQEIDQARQQAANRKADFYAKALTEANKVWGIVENDNPKTTALEIIEESKQLKNILETANPRHTSLLANIQDHLRVIVSGLFKVILSELQSRNHADPSAENLLSDEQLSEALALHTALQYASSLSEMELQAELFAMQRAHGENNAGVKSQLPGDLKNILAMRTAEISTAMNANLIIAKNLRASEEQGAEVNDSSNDLENNDVAKMTSSERYWAQAAIDELITFLAKRLELIRDAIKVN